MNFTKKLLAVLALVPGLAFAAEGGFPLDRAPERHDMASLQNGAKLFVNYCLNCHSANAMRYNRLRDLGLSEDQIKNNLLFSADKVGEMMTTAMRPADAKAWFGAVPPTWSRAATEPSRVSTANTSSSISVEKPRRVSSDISDRSHLASSQARTAWATASWASRKGRPFLTR